MLREAPGRRKQYGVQWRVDGRRRSEFFRTAELRDAKAAKLRELRRKGELSAAMTADEARQWRAFREATGGVPWADVVSGWREHLRSKGVMPSSLTVGEAVRRYVESLEARVAAGTLAEVTKEKNRRIVEGLAGDYRSRVLTSVTAELLTGWLDSLGDVAAETWNTHRKVLHALFSYHRRDLLRNPVEEVLVKADQDHQIGILGVADLRRLFDHAQRAVPELLPRLAAEAFLGLRFSSASRLERGEISDRDRGVLLPAQKTKTRRDHYIESAPDTFWAWLQLETKRSWALSERNYRRLKGQLFVDADVPHLHNCLRHSFASYHAAAFKNPGLTASILGHQNQQLLWTTYKAVKKPDGTVVTQADGLAYFSVLPDRRKP